MNYKLLSKLYYQNKSAYNDLLKKRNESENTHRLNVKIFDSTAFYCLCDDIYNLSLQIMELDQKVRVLKTSLPDVALNQFATKCLVDEIILTNNIEGVYSTRREINIIVSESSRNTGNTNRRFYGLATKYMLLSLDKIELNSCADIRNLYNELVLPEVLEEDEKKVPDGKIFRKDMAEVTTATQKVIHNGVFPEDKIIDYMESSINILNDENIPFLVRISIFHYLFGYIHPFYDGNGRTARFISSYLLSNYLDDLIGYRLSYTIKENISEYYSAFKECNNPKNKGDLTPFIISFLSIIHKAFEKLYAALCERKSALDQAMENLKKIDDLNNSETLGLCSYLIQAELFSNEGISRAELCSLLKISDTTLRKRLVKIEDCGFLIRKKIGHYQNYIFNTAKLNSIKRAE